MILDILLFLFFGASIYDNIGIIVFPWIVARGGALGICRCLLLTSTRWLGLLLDRLLLCGRRGNRLRRFCQLWLLLRVCFFRGLGVLGFNGGRWGLLGFRSQGCVLDWLRD